MQTAPAKHPTYNYGIDCLSQTAILELIFMILGLHMLELFSEQPFIFVTFIGVISLCVGSFLNVIIYRLPLMYSEDLIELRPAINLWSPRSFCPACDKAIPLWHNVPLLSYCYLKGQSACCAHIISVRYPLVEGLSLLLSILLSIHFGPSLQLIGGLILTWGLLALSFIDCAAMILPDQLILPLLTLGLLLNSVGCYCPIKSAILGAIYGYLLFLSAALLIHKIRNTPSLGGGDLKLVAMLGAWFGWQAVPLLTLIASITGTILGLTYIIFTGKNYRTLIPFGPFLAVGGFITLWIQNEPEFFSELFNSTGMTCSSLV